MVLKKSRRVSELVSTRASCMPAVLFCGTKGICILLSLSCDPDTRTQPHFTPHWQGPLQSGSLGGDPLHGRGCSPRPSCSHGLSWEWRAWTRGKSGARSQARGTCDASDPVLGKRWVSVAVGKDSFSQAARTLWLILPRPQSLPPPSWVLPLQHPSKSPSSRPTTSCNRTSGRSYSWQHLMVLWLYSYVPDS